MSLFDFIRLLYRNIKPIIIVPVTLGLAVFFFTKNQERQYSSSALMYTGIASGFNIESGTDDKLDYKAVNNAFDNLLLVIESHYTLKEVSLRLLAEHLMLDKPTEGIIGKKAFQDINEYITQDIREKALDTTVEMTYQRLSVLYDAGNPLLKNLLNKGSSHWSLKKLGEVSTKRVKSSDMVELSYVSTDPAICQRTLAIMLDVFIKRYKSIKQSETGSVVAYFEKELTKRKAMLNDAEDRLTAFRVERRIINYVEQTKAIAFKKQNAVEEFSMKQMNLKATEAALKQLEEKLKIRENILGKNVEVLDKRQRLSKIAGQIALAQTNNQGDSAVNVLTEEQQQLKEDLKKDVEMLFNFSNSKEGLPSKQLLNDWLNTIVQYEREKVVVKLFQKRLDDLDTEYDRFAPMGSTIARLEREINVYEREYLEVLHGLNMARLRQQNIEMSSNIEIMDSPELPLEPLPSKRMLIVIAAFLFGSFSVVAALVARALLDNTLQHPDKAHKDTELEIAGVIPESFKGFEKKYGDLKRKVIGIMTSTIKLEKYATNKTDATVIVNISTERHEGKKYAMKMIFQNMLESGESVCLISPGYTNNSSELGDHEYHYDITDQLASNKDLLDQYQKEYKYVLLVLPEWVSGKIPVHLIEKAKIILWTIRADKVWSVAHKKMLKNLQKITPIKPALILNGVKPYYLDQVVVDVPVKRSPLAKWVRKQLKFQLLQSNIPESED